MLVKYYLSDNIKAPFENFTLDLRNAWASPDLTHSQLCQLLYIYFVDYLKFYLAYNISQNL